MIKGKETFFLILLLFAAGMVFALDFTVIGGGGNFSFDTSSESPIGKGKFEGDFFPLGRIGIKDQVSNTFGYSAVLERDPLLRNTLICEMDINAGFFNLSVGPLFSLFNSWKTYIRPGISTSVGLEFPGIFFINIRGGATFGSGRENDYGLETARFALGFWLPNLLNTFSLTTAKFSDSGAVFTQDELFRLSYRLDMYAKNFPYTISIEMGYQTLKRAYESLADDLIRAGFIGFETSIYINPSFCFHIGAEAPVFVWGKLPLERAKDRWFFRAFTGFTWTFQKPE